MIRWGGWGAAAMLAGCTGGAAVEVSVEIEPEPAPPPVLKPETPTPEVDDRSPYDLASAIATAQRGPSLDRAQALESLRADWRGKRYRWQVGVSAPLCSQPDACTVFPFDHASQQTRIVQGWLPRLRLSEAAHDDLLARCGAGLCVATVEATLSTFVLSVEDPTSLTLSDVTVVDVRARRETESWVRRKADPRVAKLRTSKAAR